MALPSSRQQREYDKFVQRADGQTALAVDIEAADQGGGGAGGGGSLSNVLGDFTATINDATNTFDVSGISLSAALLAGGVMYVIDSSGDVTKLPTTNVSISGSTVTLGDMSGTFSTGDTLNITVAGLPRQYDSGTGSDKVYNINPLNELHFEETLADVTNGRWNILLLCRYGRS